MALYGRKDQDMSENTDKIEEVIPDDVDPLTPEQRAICTRRGFPTDEYLAYIEATDGYLPYVSVYRPTSVRPSRVHDAADQVLTTEGGDESL
jgi:hypothetical protein